MLSLYVFCSICMNLNLKVETNSGYRVYASATICMRGCVTMATAIHYTPLCFKSHEVTWLNINVQRYSEAQSITNSIIPKCSLLMWCKTLNITSRWAEFDISCHGDLNIQNGNQQDYESSNLTLIIRTNALTHGGGAEWLLHLDLSCFPHGLVAWIPCDRTMCWGEAVALASSW